MATWELWVSSNRILNQGKFIIDFCLRKAKQKRMHSKAYLTAQVKSNVASAVVSPRLWIWWIMSPNSSVTYMVALHHKQKKRRRKKWTYGESENRNRKTAFFVVVRYKRWNLTTNNSKLWIRFTCTSKFLASYSNIYEGETIIDKHITLIYCPRPRI